jgi:indole-3-glycerol phosphate synthase
VSDLLVRLAQASRDRAASARSSVPERELVRRALDTPPPPRLQLGSEGFDVIAEVKRRAPSAGVFPASTIDERVRDYASAGAAAISVLTEPDAFGGSLADLERAACVTPVPILRKDFLVDPYQVAEARAAGAAGVLLILRLLERDQLASMLEAAAALRLFVLLEVFDESDVEKAGAATTAARALGIDTLVGVNCRDLATLGVDRTRFARLGPFLPVGPVPVAESGVETADHAAEVAALGYQVALVGSSLMRAPHPSALLAELLAAGREAARRGDRRCASG